MDEGKTVKERGTLGILGGMGPEATVVLYSRITTHTVAAKDQDHLNIWIYSHAGLPDRTACILNGEGDRMRELFRRDMEHFSALGCDYLAVPCNTSHNFRDVFNDYPGITFVDMIKETAKYVFEKGVKRVGILATDGTMKAGLYEQALAEYGICAYAPDEKDQQLIMKVIYEEIKKGAKGDMNHFSPVVQHLKSEGCEAVILGCTELSVFADNHGLKDDFYVDAMDVLAKKCVTLCGGTWHD